MMEQTHSTKNSRDRGFSLVEILVVIVILGIIAAIAIPVFLNQREKAAVASTKENLHNLLPTVFSAREAQKTNLQGVTGTGCTDCPCRNVTLLRVSDLGFTTSPCGMAWLNMVTKIAAAAGEPLEPTKKLFIDGWGYPIVVDENEGDYTPCGTPDTFESAGPNHVITLGGDDIKGTAMASGYC